MAAPDDSQEKQFLTFTLREEHFAVPIAKVREVLDVSHVTRIPRMPDYLNGVINLRGSVVPVMDLGLKLGMAPIARTVRTSVMITEIRIGEDQVLIGCLTDAVQMVLDLSADEIEPVPRMGTALNTDFIKGMGRQQDRFLILLDLDMVLASEGKAALREFMEAQAKTG